MPNPFTQLAESYKFGIKDRSRGPRKADAPYDAPDYAGAFSSFSGADIRILLAMPAASGNEPIFVELATVQTLTYSIFREKVAVRSVGTVGERGRTRGTRTCAGSMVNTVFDRHVLYNVMRRYPGDPAKNAISPDSGYIDLEHTLPDQLPPFDIVVSFANEHGHASEMVIFGIDIVSEGQVMSIEDMITENTMQYTAQHVAIMRPGGYRKAVSAVTDQYGNEIPSIQPTTFKSIIGGAQSEQLKDLINKSFNPFR